MPARNMRFAARQDWLLPRRGELDERLTNCLGKLGYNRGFRQYAHARRDVYDFDVVGKFFDTWVEGCPVGEMLFYSVVVLQMADNEFRAVGPRKSWGEQ